jgi:hypothetical protein
MRAGLKILRAGTNLEKKKHLAVNRQCRYIIILCNLCPYLFELKTLQLHIVIALTRKALEHTPERIGREREKEHFCYKLLVLLLMMYLRETVGERKRE